MTPRQQRVLLFAGIAGLAAACVVLFFFDPERYHFYPVCVFHEVTGWECPGCGGLRATHQLLHGNIAAAWHFNAMVVLLAPAAAWFALREVVRQTTGRILPGSPARPAFLWTVLPAFVLFAVLRNVL
jgi:hypothetical protein